MKNSVNRDKLTINLGNRFLHSLWIKILLPTTQEEAVDNNLTSKWKEALELIHGELSDISYRTWFPALEPTQYENNIFYIKTPDSFSRSLLDSRYKNLTNIALSYVYKNDDIQVCFYFSDNELAAQKAQSAAAPEKNETGKDSQVKETPQKDYRTNLNPNYTFEKFVVGENNRFAHAACVAVSEAPSERYNPLFIYGGVGLGKTHLMQAIGNYVHTYFPEKKVVYTSCETFTNEFIEAIQKKDNYAFRNRYRNVDILLIDDIQFLAGKEGTQEEFFHTFNTLHDENKQIVISSDRPPREIPNLAERLISRFEMGLMTDISAPNFETRMAILRKKAESNDDPIPDEVMSYIADNIHSNIRELEGALTTVVAYSKLHGESITLQFAQEALKDRFVSKKHEITCDYIKEVTAKYYDITVEEMNGKRRTKAITTPRQVAMYLCRELTPMSLPKIGEAFGGRDHTTVMHACEKISNSIEKSEDFKNLVIRISNEIKGED